MRYDAGVLGWLLWLLWLLVRIVAAAVVLIAMVFVASLSPNPGHCPSCSSALGVDREHFWEDPGSGDYCTVCGWHRSDER